MCNFVSKYSFTKHIFIVQDLPRRRASKPQYVVSEEEHDEEDDKQPELDELDHEAEAEEDDDMPLEEHEDEVIFVPKSSNVFVF